ncbi:MAG: sulfurtransferase complex subunit TusB [Endozoicomonas sp.]
MSTLHTINKTGQPLELCLRSLSQGDSLLFIEDGVYQLLEALDVLEDVSHSFKLYALEADLAARGISGDSQIFATPVSYRQFVKMTESHDKILSWF